MNRRVNLALWIAAGMLAALSPAARAQPGAPTNAAAGDACCNVVANAALHRLGRVVVTYPANGVDARLVVYRAGQTKSIADGYGNKAIDLIPGTYDLEISGKRIAGVQVQAGHDTQVKVGALHVQAGKGTRIEIVEPGSDKELVDAYGEKLFGLPVGQFGVRVSGQTETVTVTEGETTEF